MKAEIDMNGVLRIYPETPTESFAVKAWVIKSGFKVEDFQRNENYWFRGSSIQPYYVDVEESLK